MSPRIITQFWILPSKIKYPHLHECGGNGKCTTCRIRILEGLQNVSSKTHLEVGLAHSRKWDPSIRLACQSYVKGDVKVQRLIWSIAEVNKLQLEVAPEGKAEERPIAMIFCDLRNFTQLSEKNSNFDIAWFLNRFYTELGGSHFDEQRHHLPVCRR